MHVFIDVNECAEAIDDLCTDKDTVCHNTEGSFKCVPLKKRDVGLSCPAGFKRNVVNQVCDGKLKSIIAILNIFLLKKYILFSMYCKLYGCGKPPSIKIRE